MSEPSTGRAPFIRRKWAVIAGVLLMAVLLGWLWGRGSQSKVASPPAAVVNRPATDVDQLVQYQLPTGWSKVGCAASDQTVYLLPTGFAAPNHCGGPITAPVKLTILAAGPTECNELPDEQHITKHVCKSLFIDGRKSLLASTTYGAGSLPGDGTTVDTYYIPGGNTVLSVSFTHAGGTAEQAAFDQMVRSMDLK